jgi:hypothetical protein
MTENSKKENARHGLHFDDFVQAARPNVKDKNPLVFVQGYIGKSPVANSIRVYTDPSLNNFIDILTADIVHSLKVTDDPLGLGGSRIWIKLPTSDDKTANSYLAGNLYDDFIKKVYDQSTTTGRGDVGQITDFTRTLATDFTRPAMTDITKVFATDFTRPRFQFMTRYINVATRACPPWDFKPGNLTGGVEGSYYY